MVATTCPFTSTAVFDLQSAQETEDATNETFERAMRSLAGFPRRVIPVMAVQHRGEPRAQYRPRPPVDAPAAFWTGVSRISTR